MNLTNSANGKFDFETYFRSNYEKTIEKHLQITKISDFMLYGAFFFVFCSFVLLSANSSVLALYSMFLFVILFLFNPFLKLCSRLFLKVSDREVIAYHLFKAAYLLKRNRVEENKKSKGFIKDALKHLEKFNALLTSMLKRAKLEMPFALPDFENLNVLRENIMTRIYPRIQEERVSKILFSLASIFSLERNYFQIAEVNVVLKNTLNPPKPFEKGTLFSSLTKSIKSSLAIIAILSLVGVIIATFGAVIILRFPVVGFSIDWKYISDNSAMIVVGILAGWAALIVLFKPKGEK